MEKSALVLFIDSPGACNGKNRARFPQMGWALRPGLMSDKAHRLYREFQTSEMSSAWPGKDSEHLFCMYFTLLIFHCSIDRIVLFFESDYMLVHINWVIGGKKESCKITKCKLV